MGLEKSALRKKVSHTLYKGTRAHNRMPGNSRDTPRPYMPSFLDGHQQGLQGHGILKTNLISTRESMQH
jgi:hypothetical protein